MATDERTTPIAPGIFRIRRGRRAVGFRVWVSVFDPLRPKGRLVTKRFEPETPLKTMKQWREDQRVAARVTRQAHRPHSGFRKDAERYLEAVAAMTSYDDRQRDIGHWVLQFESRPRASITSSEVAAALATWANSGLAPATVNHRRTALMHLFNVLDGKDAPNPARAVPKLREPDPQARGLSYDIIRRILAAMPASKSRARLKVMAWTGIPHAQIATLTAHDIDYAQRTVTVRGRRKGAGAPGRTQPLTAEGVLALREFARLKAWGPFSRSSLRKAFRLAVSKVEAEEAKKPAAKRVSLAGVRPYDLRHSYGTAMYAATGDIRATQVLMGHSRESMTHRYTLGAVDARLAEAVRRFSEVTAPMKKAPR